MRVPSPSAIWIAVQLAVAALAGATWALRGDSTETWPALLTLSLGAMLCATLSDRFGGGEGAARLALSFVLAALVVLPPTGALWVALLATLAGRGRGVTTPATDPSRAVLALLVAVSAVELLAVLVGTALPRDGLSGVPWVLAGYLIVQGLSHTLSGTPRRTAGSLATEPRAVWVGASCIPFAWLLARSYIDFHWAESLILIALVAGFQGALVGLDRTIAALRVSNRQIASRVGELDALRAISAETVSSLVPEHVFQAVDRGCRRMFDVDSCLIALAERHDGTLTLAHHTGPGSERRGAFDPLADLPFERIVRTPGGVRLDPARATPKNRCSILRRARSMMAVPLVVEDRVIGMLALCSRRDDAYDDHQLQLLRTVGQQAAMAIENANHYQLATVDALTGLFLRDYFFNRLNEEMQRCGRYGGRFSLLMLDLDGFKQVNDLYGHLVGDDFLREASETIRGQLRAADIACRYGGDEFCLLLPETDIEGATVIGERIRAAVLGQALEVRGRRLQASVSIGLTIYPDCAATSGEAMLQQADEALYRAKRGGRNRVVSFAA